MIEVEIVLKYLVFISKLMHAPLYCHFCSRCRFKESSQMLAFFEFATSCFFMFSFSAWQVWSGIISVFILDEFWVAAGAELCCSFEHFKFISCTANLGARHAWH